MDPNEFHTILEDAGFSPYQADAYTTLLELGSAPASEIASTSGVPQPRIYDVL
ncbi:helix-turn-helix domain-containing protein [Haladaptatus sp. DFWS20]|uniref:helix-turn-helix domain-containing protein n=1 Tax=Haladaptatus sp. DFWS20 TaxID=3403467 RepID=UPI003EB9E7A7